MHTFAKLVAIVVSLMVIPMPAYAATIVEDFSTMPVGSCIDDGRTIGSWLFVYDGYGCNVFVALSGNTILLEQPEVATQPYETHGSLVVGPATTGDVTVQVDMATTRQLRTGSAPNTWEVGWLLWHYTDDLHFYYVILKPNGWEIGKEDPAYPGAQRFLATGSSPQFPIGPWYRVRVVQSGGTIQLFVNDLLISTVVDNDSPYTGGRIGLYTEDSESYFDNAVVTSAGKGKKRR
jgi:hypothetical protein